jgi:predicted hotdog family 3-hydroxylacyl-ACP dehydratase
MSAIAYHGLARHEPAVAGLVPHAGLMCLLEEVLAWDNARVLVGTRTHRRADHPLRFAGRLDALHLCEYGAQAMAVHGGLLAHRDGGRAAPGMLVSLRDVQVAGVDLATLPGPLRIGAQRLHGDANGWQYAFEAWHGSSRLASGRAAVVLRDAASGGG